MLWVAHAMGWGVLVLLVAGYEIWRLWRSRGVTFPQACIGALIVLPPVLLTLYWQDTREGVAFDYHSDLLTRKIMNWIVILRGDTRIADVGLPLALGTVLALCLWRGLLSVDGRAASGAALLTLACILMPTTVFGSWGADERLAPIAIMVAVLSLRWTGSAHGAVLLTSVSAALFVVRTGSITHRWFVQDRAYTSHLRALDFVPRGSRVHAIVLQDTCRSSWTSSAYIHLSDLAIVRRDALVNSQWFQPGAPLLRVTYPTDLRFKYDPSQFVAGFTCSGFDPGPLHVRLAQLSPDNWDFVWILQTRGTQDLWPGREPLFIDGNSELYGTR